MRHGSASGKGPPATNAQPRWQATHPQVSRSSLADALHRDRPVVLPPHRLLRRAFASASCCPCSPDRTDVAGLALVLALPQIRQQPERTSALVSKFGVSIRSIVASHWSSDAEPLAGRAAAAAAAAAGRDGSLRNEKAAMSNFARSSREPPDRQLPNRKRNSGQHEKQAERVSRTSRVDARCCVPPVSGVPPSEEASGGGVRAAVSVGGR